ncbi:hypothetical protein KC878_02705 [Candidatus Saccharibacteria bacterium]|nr:hypothetical protein [Candidatus Saccharibacteria bacterium]MCB9821283.1 hypothetical protein [Candidatus Nomurabacteria bacterium]
MKVELNLEELRVFLNKADKPHADGTAKIVREPDGSSSISFADGNWKMHDNFFGGEPYGGRQVVYFKNQPVWLFVYYGQITDKSLDVHPIYNFLRKSLQQAPVNGFSRGPASYRDGSLEYRNQATGSLESFKGREVILSNDTQVYWAEYMGGLVDIHARGEY